jgi:hypothetical protein
MGNNIANKFAFIVVYLQLCFVFHELFKHCSDINRIGKYIDIAESACCPLRFNVSLLSEPEVC